MTIMFFVRPNKQSCFLFSDAIFKKYENKSDFVFVTQNKDENKLVAEATAAYRNNCKIYCISDYLKENWEFFDVNRIKYLCAKYSVDSIWKYILTDRFLLYKNYEYTIKVSCGIFCFFDMIFQNEKIDIYYDETIATYESYICYLIAKELGVQYLALMIAKGLDKTHHYYVRDPYQHNWDMEKIEDLSISDRDYKDASAFIENFRKSAFKPEFMQVLGKKPKLSLRLIGLLFSNIINRFKPVYNNKYDYINYQGNRRTLDGLKFYFKYLYCKKYYQNPTDEEYYLFPLHYQPEATTLVCAEKYEEQIYFIDSIAKSMPAGVKLYVKEHYARVGHRPLEFYKKIIKYPNVKVIDPWIDSKSLISNAKAIITLTGTAGFEAVIMKKPVVMCGEFSYEKAPGVIRVNDIFDNLVPALNKWQEPSEKELTMYFAKYIKSLKEGCSNSEISEYFNQDNIKKMKMSFVEEVERVCNEKQ